MLTKLLSPRTQLYVAVLTLVLSGCQRTTPASPETLTGVIAQGWSGQAASLRLDAVTFSSESGTVLAEVPIGADGRFTTTLPTQEDVAGALTPVEGCESLEVSPSPLNVVYAEARVYASTAASAEKLGVLGYQADVAGTLVSVILIYADAAGRVSGSCQDLGLDFDLDLLEGWNQVLYAQRGNSTTLTTGDLPDGLRWRFYATQ